MRKRGCKITLNLKVQARYLKKVVRGYRIQKTQTR